MKITQEEVSHVAKLSKLDFSPEETAEFATTLTKIVDMVELLNEVDTEGVPFTSNVAANINYMREDVAQPGWNREELFQNVPEKERGYIKVPAILDDGGDA